MIWKYIGNKGVKPGSMIQMNEMAKLVHDHATDADIWRSDEVFVECDHSCAGARPPATPHFSQPESGVPQRRYSDKGQAFVDHR